MDDAASIARLMTIENRIESDTFMSGSALKLILASGSPRRRQLLAATGLEFDVIDSGVEEHVLAGEGADTHAARLAREKALAVSRRYPDAIVIGADTTVECGGRIFDKPAGEADARAMLSALSGNLHLVVTAFAVARGGEILEAAAVHSRVRFRSLALNEIDDYIRSGEPLDKAGAYGSQGAGAGFITEVDGPRDNVMGLPLENVLAALRRAGIEPTRR
jgi:nucleoside triphosphate pyrophosphatase